jgi:hypothetical protein
MAYRKAKGLCYKCGLRWGPQHKCSNIVPLHIVEELWQLLDNSASQETDSVAQPVDEDDLMVLSVHAI